MTAFDATPEFQQFKDVMRRVLAIPKGRLTALVREAREASPRKDNPHAPGQKKQKRKRSVAQKHQDPRKEA